MSTTSGSARRSRASPLCRERLAACNRSLQEQYVLRTWQKAPRLPETADEHDPPFLTGNGQLPGCSQHAPYEVNVIEISPDREFCLFLERPRHLIAYSGLRLR